MSQTHKCPIPGCTVQCRSSIVMCREHWFQVPKPLRERVWATWRTLQQGATRQSADDYRQARAESITSVTEVPV